MYNEEMGANASTKIGKGLGGKGSNSVLEGELGSKTGGDVDHDSENDSPERVNSGEIPERVNSEGNGSEDGDESEDEYIDERKCKCTCKCSRSRRLVEKHIAKRGNRRDPEKGKGGNRSGRDRGLRRDHDDKTGTREALTDEERARRSRMIVIIYVVGIILWIILILALDLFTTGKLTLISFFIILIPIAIFAFGIYNSKSITVEVEDELFVADYLPFGLIIVIPLLTWISKDYKGDKRQFINITIVAIILSMLSILDVWVAPKNLFAIKHIKSVLQTMSIALIVFAVYSYYSSYPQDVLE